MTIPKRKGRIYGATFPKNLCNQQLNSTQNGRLKQAIPRPGTALTAFLRKYRVELYPYRNHDHGQALLAAILLLLTQAEQS